MIMMSMSWKLALAASSLPFQALLRPLYSVAPVPEGHDGADVEVVLAHADAGLPRLRHRLVQHPLVHLHPKDMRLDMAKFMLKDSMTDQR